MGWLAIVRHGEAGPGSPDAERGLTPRGLAEAQSAAAWIDAQPMLANARLWSSPLRRARQTAEAIGATAELRHEVVEGITPEDDENALIERLLQADASEALIVVSHMPFVGALTARLVEGRASGLTFPTAGIALLQADVWAAGCATLKAFAGPPHPISSSSASHE